MPNSTSQPTRTFEVMTVGGLRASDVVAETADQAAEIVSQRGHEVLDVMDNIVVIAD